MKILIWFIVLILAFVLAGAGILYGGMATINGSPFGLILLASALLSIFYGVIDLRKLLGTAQSKVVFRPSKNFLVVTLVNVSGLLFWYVWLLRSLAE